MCRLGRLILHLHSERSTARNKCWASFLTSQPGARLARASLAQCDGLNSLYVQHIATDDMLKVVADTCSKLTILDISFSSEVTDIGLVYLCGPLVGAGRSSETPPKGCKYLRELYCNPQHRQEGKQIMPQVIACLLRHLQMLQVTGEQQTVRPIIPLCDISVTSVSQSCLPSITFVIISSGPVQFRPGWNEGVKL